MPVDTYENAGGKGGSPAARFDTTDTRLAARALAESWSIPPATRAAMLARLEAIVANPESKGRTFFAATKALAGLSRLNLAAVDCAIRANTHEELADRVTALEERAAERGQP
jgi:hypothetical protein